MGAQFRILDDMSTWAADAAPAGRKRPAPLAAPLLARETLALVLCGGRGTRLGPLTDDRAKPAVPFGSGWRLVDFTLANCVNSGVRRIAVLTQYKAQSLIRHIQQGWALSPRCGEFVEVVPAQQRQGSGWYAGTADAVFQNLDLIEPHAPSFVLVLGGDHVYKMDYTALLADHVAMRADVTVACLEVPVEEASAFGVMQVDAQHRVVGFDEKPVRPVPLPGRQGRALVSMGVYVFSTAALLAALKHDAQDRGSAHDFGRDVVPEMLRSGRRVASHDLSCSGVRAPGSPPYWRDVGTLDAYWEAHMELTDPGCGLDLFDRAWPVPACGDSAAPTRFLDDETGRHGVVQASVIGSGCVIGAAGIVRSVLAAEVQVQHRAQIEESVLLPAVEVGRGVCLRRCIVEQGCRLPPGLSAGFDPAADRRRFHVTPRGITVITPGMLGPPAR